MKHKYQVDILTGDGLDELIEGVEQYQKWLVEKAELLCQRLSELGATVAGLGFSQAIYTGPNSYSISTEKLGDSVYAVRADGDTVLIVEFGAGVTYGGGHPEAAQTGMVVGSYPGQKHAFDPKGWWLPKAAGGGHTYGNPANAPMYNAVKTLDQEFAFLVQEVFHD